MKLIIILLIALLTVSCAKSNLVHFSNNFAIIAKTDNSVPTLASRILKLREFGECDDKQCPNEVLYITVSEFGEYPEQTLYITPKANEWQFTGWVHIPELGEINPTLAFTLKSINNSKEISYLVKANLTEIKYIAK